MIIKDLFTEKDGESFCPVRAGVITAFIIYTGGIFNDWWHVSNFIFSDHAKDIAAGYKDIVAWGGAAIAGKSYTEPNP